MKYILFIILFATSLYSVEQNVDPKTPTTNDMKVESVKVFTKEEIRAIGLNPERVCGFSTHILVLPTGERILYTIIQIQYNVPDPNSIFGDYRTTYMTQVTTTKL